MDQTQHQSESRKRKLFATVAVMAVMAGIGGFVTSAAFTATSSNSGNRIESGSVAIGDSDAGTGSLYNALDQGPGSGPAAACVRVTYSGSLGSAVKLYRSALANGDRFHLTVERGSGLTGPAANMNCTGFTPAAGAPAFDDTLDQFPTTYAGGVDGKASGAAWATSNSVDYRFTVDVVDDSTPNAHTSEYDTGSHSFTWEAQNN